MDRRHFLWTLAPLAAAPAFALQAAKSGGRLRITDIRVVPLRKIRDVGSLEPAWNPGGKTTYSVGGGSYVEVQTDKGLSGIGPGMDPALLPAVKAQLVGEDPFDTERHLARLRYFSTIRPSPITATGFQSCAILPWWTRKDSYPHRSARASAWRSTRT